MSAGRSAARAVVVALAVTVVGTFALSRRWVANDHDPATSPPLVASSPAVAPSGGDWAAVRGTSATLPVADGVASPSPGGTAATGASPHARSTPPVVDLSSLPRVPRGQRAEERFPTNEWFTQEDQRHPERYFEAAERIPELDRPEERRQTLAYFQAYRGKLERDRAAVIAGSAEGRQIEDAIARYDVAIARLRALIDADAER